MNLVTLLDNDQSSKTTRGILSEPMTYEDIINLFANFLQHYGLELTWIEKLEIFGDRYNLNIEYLVEILDDPKVIPMIRGKSFEFTVQSYLSEILSSQYQVTNPRLNPQAGFKDVDVCKANQFNRIECSRKRCSDLNCNFIPNYPKIYFDAETGEPIFPWLSINQIETILI